MTTANCWRGAARAAGLVLVLWQPDGTPHACYGQDAVSWRWNPLTDDGDALRLAVKLGIRIEPWPSAPEGIGGKVERDGDVWLIDGVSGAATRRAIVRAAAAAGGEHG